MGGERFALSTCVVLDEADEEVLVSYQGWPTKSGIGGAG